VKEGRGKPARKTLYKFLVSACLAGVNCAHNGKDNLNKKVKKLVFAGAALPVCPEVLGGLGVPRQECEIVGGDGSDVLCGKARVVSSSGRDVTKNFLAGTKIAVGLAKRYGIRKAVLKSKSPSCGAGYIYDGTFKNVLKKGDGVLAAALKSDGIRCLSQKRKHLKVRGRKW